MIVISLYDYTGVMVRPWADAGYTCYCVDIQHPAGETLRDGITYVGADVGEWELPKSDEEVVMVFAFPPCTDVAISGATHFKKKGLQALIDSLQLFQYAIKIAEKYECAYFLENPVSTISTYWRKPDYMFSPWEYGGYLPEDDVNPVSELIPPRDAYNKRTCLWVGEGFTMPDKLPIDKPEGTSPMYKKLGGKSARTKNIRSATPRGFAQAVFEFNKV